MSEKSSFEFLQLLANKEKVGRVIEDAGEGAAFLGVVVHSKTFYIPVGQIREIIPNPKITAIGHTKLWLTGLLKAQGEIYSVIDIAVLLSFTEKSHKNPLAIAISMPDGNYAMLVSSVLGITKASQLQQVENDDYTITYKIAGGDTIVALSMPSIVKSSEFANMSIF